MEEPRTGITNRETLPHPDQNQRDKTYENIGDGRRVHRHREADQRNKGEPGQQGSDNGAEAVQEIERRDIAPRVLDPFRNKPDEDRQRPSHQDGGKEQGEEAHHQLQHENFRTVALQLEGNDNTGEG